MSLFCSLAKFNGANCLIEVPKDRAHLQHGNAVSIVLLELGSGQLL